MSYDCFAQVLTECELSGPCGVRTEFSVVMSARQVERSRPDTATQICQRQIFDIDDTNNHIDTSGFLITKEASLQHSNLVISRKKTFNIISSLYLKLSIFYLIKILNKKQFYTFQLKVNISCRQNGPEG